MKKFKIIINIFLFFSFLFTSFSYTFADFWDIFWSPSKIQYCENDGECWLDAWTNLLKDPDKWIKWIVTDWNFSEYILKVIKYLLWFIMIIGVVYIIYAWFNILTAAWDEAKVWKSKKIIMYVVIWLIIIFLSITIISFFFDVLDSGTNLDGVNNV